MQDFGALEMLTCGVSEPIRLFARIKLVKETC